MHLLTTFDGCSSPPCTLLSFGAVSSIRLCIQPRKSSLIYACCLKVSNSEVVLCHIRVWKSNLDKLCHIYLVCHHFQVNVAPWMAMLGSLGLFEKKNGWRDRLQFHSGSFLCYQHTSIWQHWWRWSFCGRMNVGWNQRQVFSNKTTYMICPAKRTKVPLQRLTRYPSTSDFVP